MRIVDCEFKIVKAERHPPAVTEFTPAF